MKRWARVGAFVALSEALYLGLAVAFPLARLYARVPPVDFAKLTGYRLPASGGLFLAYLVLFGLLAGLVGRDLGFRARGERLHLPPRLILGASLMFGVTLLFLYPIFAIDMLMYAVRTRLWVLHGANPFLVPPANFPTDPWVGLTGEWIGATSGYSPLWEMVALLPAWVAGAQRFLLHLWGLKGIALLAYLTDVWLLYRLAHVLYPDGWTARLVYFAWNPLVLLELVGNGHNDGLMLTFMLLTLWLVVQGRDGLAHLALAASVLIKVTPVFLWPLLWAWGVAQRETWAARARYTAGVAVVVLITLGIFAVFLWPDPSPWQALRESESSSRTFQTLFILIAMAARVPHAYARVQLVFRALFAIAYLGILVWLWRSVFRRPQGRAWVPLLHAWLGVLALLVLVFASHWRPWYTTWLLPLAALSPSRVWTGSVFLLSFTAATGDLYWTNWRWRFREYLSPLVAHLIGVPYVLGIPVIWAVWKMRQGESASNHYEVSRRFT